MNRLVLSITALWLQFASVSTSCAQCEAACGRGCDPFQTCEIDGIECEYKLTTWAIILIVVVIFAILYGCKKGRG